MIKILGEQFSIPQEILIARKRETQHFSGTNYGDVAGLGATLEAGADYLVRGLVLMTIGSTGGAKFSFLSSASQHAIKGSIFDWIDSIEATYLLTAQQTDVTADVGAGDNSFEINGFIGGATGGGFRIIAAQSTSPSGNDALTVYAGSYLQFTRIK